MAFKLESMLKPSESVAASLATAGLVYGVYMYSMPSMVEVHGAQAHNIHVDSARKKAMWTSVAVVSGVFLLTKDANVFIIGGIAFLALEWSYRHANAVGDHGRLVPFGRSAQASIDQGYTDTPMEADQYSG